MPTGYTADVTDGTMTSARDFILLCARAMGACIMQRDDPMTDTPKLVEPSTDYHDRALVQARADLLALEQMTDDDVIAAQEAERGKAITARDEAIAKSTEVRSRYNAMKAKVLEWVPPTDEHKGLKTFMLDQLNQSEAFDCTGGSYYTVPDIVAADDWRHERRKKLLKDIGYHEQHRAEEIDRTTSRNRWITALYESLGQVAA